MGSQNPENLRMSYKHRSLVALVADEGVNLAVRSDDADVPVVYDHRNIFNTAFTTTNIFDPITTVRFPARPFGVLVVRKDNQKIDRLRTSMTPYLAKFHFMNG